MDATFLSPRAQKNVQNYTGQPMYKLQDQARERMVERKARMTEQVSEQVAEQATKQVSFTEAPASVSIKCYSSSGFDVMVTIRDGDTAALMGRMKSALSWLDQNGYRPTRNGNGGGNGSGASSNGNGAAAMCPTHNKPMKASQHGGFFCPVRIADDDGTGKPVYCKQKVN